MLASSSSDPLKITVSLLPFVFWYNIKKYQNISIFSPWFHAKEPSLNCNTAFLSEKDVVVGVYHVTIVAIGHGKFWPFVKGCVLRTALSYIYRVQCQANLDTSGLEKLGTEIPIVKEYRQGLPTEIFTGLYIIQKTMRGGDGC